MSQLVKTTIEHLRSINNHELEARHCICQLADQLEGLIALRVSHAELVDQVEGLKVSLFEATADKQLIAAELDALRVLLGERSDALAQIQSVIHGQRLPQDQGDKLGEILAILIDSGYGI